VPFPIQDADGAYKFANSEIITRYMFAAEQLRAGAALEILDRIFTWRDDDMRLYQDLFNSYYSREEAIEILDKWLTDYGFDKDGLKKLHEIVESPEITDKMSENRNIVENELKVRGIPTMVYNGKKHTGLWKADE
jgi:hypothetical protein